MRISLILAAALAPAAWLAADGAKPIEPKPAEVRVAPTSDLYLDELNQARRLHGDWNNLDDELDRALQGAPLRDPNAYRNLRERIRYVLRAKTAELEAWTVYYQKSADYWQSVLKTIQTGQPARSTERQDLVNMLGLEKRERDDIQRRLSDLSRALSEKGLSADQPAVTDLRKLLALKEDNTDKIERAIQEFDSGIAHLDKRRELARMRSLQARQLLRSVEVERPLWEALYNGRIHRVDLEYDQGIPEPEARPDWRTKLGRK